MYVAKTNSILVFKMWKIVFYFSCISFISIPVFAKVKCSVDIKSFRKTNQPVYERYSGELVLNVGREILFNRSEHLYATCRDEGNFLKISSGSEFFNGGPQQTLTCDRGVSFRADPTWVRDRNVDLTTIECNKVLPSLVEPIDYSCGGQNSPHTTVNVGIRGVVYHSLIKSCFDKQNYRVLYATHNMTASVASIQSLTRPEFTTHNLFRPIRMDQIYQKKSQSTIISGILNGYSPITDNTFLVRGHLVPFADFSLFTMQRATCTLFNVAPQWNRFNNGNWKYLENDIRTKVIENNMNVRIYTGTFGILELTDVNNNLQQIYLSLKPRGIPVPKWFYKVVIDTKTSNAVVFLGLNNPFVKISQARKWGNDICQDVCDSSRFSWLKWEKTNITQGYSICCEVQEFRSRLHELPNFYVRGLLDFGH